MKVGYCRISTDTQSLHSQIEALKCVGCDKIFTEVASGVKRDRPVLAEVMDYLRPNAHDTSLTSSAVSGSSSDLIRASCFSAHSVTNATAFW